MNWSDISFTIDGHPIDVDMTYEAKPEPEYGMDLSVFSVFRQQACEATAECTIPMASFDAFASLFHREPVGASHATLAKRVRYGGRKGRSARRRLFARALPLEMTSAHGTFRGKGIMLDETEMIVRMRSTL